MLRQEFGAIANQQIKMSFATILKNGHLLGKGLRFLFFKFNGFLLFGACHFHFDFSQVCSLLAIVAQLLIVLQSLLF